MSRSLTSCLSVLTGKYDLNQTWLLSNWTNILNVLIFSSIVGFTTVSCFVLETFMIERWQALFGLIVWMTVCFVISSNLESINYRPVLIGFTLQFLIALLVLRTTYGFIMGRLIAMKTQQIMDFGLPGGWAVFGTEDHSFLSMIVPIIVFFSSMLSVAYHIGLMNFIVRVFNLVIRFYWFLCN